MSGSVIESSLGVGKKGCSSQAECIEAFLQPCSHGLFFEGTIHARAAFSHGSAPRSCHTIVILLVHRATRWTFKSEFIKVRVCSAFQLHILIYASASVYDAASRGSRHDFGLRTTPKVRTHSIDTD
jgi:hypothetical protein